jgi:hypothetical protein
MFDLRGRPPGASVISECLEVQSMVPPRSRLARVLGVSPLTQDSRPWYVGALGEVEVGRRLAALDATWLVLHAVPIGTGTSDLDHVVVGPAGVFTINTKFHEGKDVWAGSKRILVGGQKTDHLRNARFEASRAAERLSAATGAPVEVTPILAFVAARRMTIRERPADVVILRERELGWWLRRRAPSVTPDSLAHIVAAATDASTWHRDPSEASVDLKGFASLQREVHGAKWRRFGWGLGGIAVVVAGVVILWTPAMAAIAG